MRVHGDLVEAGVEVLTSDPTGFEGRVYYNSDDDHFKIYTSGSWKIIAQGSFEIDLRNTPTDGDIFVYSSGSSRWVHTARGNVIYGAASSTDNAVIRWDGTDGEDTQNSLVIIDDSGNISTPGEINGASPTEINALSGVTSNIQSQLGDKVTGGASSTDNALARFNGTGGKTIQNSGATLDNSGNLTTPGDVNGASPAELSRLSGLSSNVQTQLDAKEDTITAGTTTQYYRGDKSFQTLDKDAVGLTNVDNTSDANKPVSTAQQTEIDTKQDDLISTRGDLIYGNSSGDATRLPLGTTGQVLTSDGTDVSWENAASGFSDPTTTRGDIIYKDSGGSTTRLPAGTSGQVLTSDGTDISWENSASGFADPTTTRGDIIYKNSSGTTTRLPAGTSGQVLTSDGTDISWDDPSGGGGSGDVVGPASSTDNTLPRYDGTTGKLLQASGATLDDSGNLTTTGDVNGASPTEMGYLAGTSSAIQTQIDAKEDSLPLSTRGDILYRNASNTTARLPVGTSGQILTSDGTDISWENAASGFSDPTTTRGDIIYKDSGGTTTRLAAGTSGQVLTSDGTDISWEDAAGGSSDTISSSTTATSDGRDGAVYLSPSNIGADNGTGGNIMVDSTRYSSAIGYQNIDLVFHPNLNLPIKNSSTNRSVVIGGADNRVGKSHSATIGGNSIDNDGEYAGTVAGRNNDLSASSDYCFVGGGRDHVINGTYGGYIGGFNTHSDADYGGVVGGRDNTLEATGSDYSFIGAGRVNSVEGQYSAICGSYLCSISGSYSFTAGHRIETIGQSCIAFGEYGYTTDTHSFSLFSGQITTLDSTREQNCSFQVLFDVGNVKVGRFVDQVTTGIGSDENVLEIHTLNASNQSNYYGLKASESMTTSYTEVKPTAIAASAGQIAQVESISGSEIIMKWSSQLWVPHNDAGNSGTSLAIDFDDGNVQTITLTGNVTFTFSNPKAGAAYTLILKQDGTGSRTVTWPAAVKWPGGTAPTITTAASSIDVVTIIYDGTDYLGGFNQDYS